MKDGIIKGSGNSRFLKSVENFKTLYPTYDAFVSALVAGTLPVDLNGINTAGWEQIGDALGKYALLKDTTAEALGLGDAALPDNALRVLSRLHSGLGNEYLWAKISTSSGIVLGNQVTTTINNGAAIYYSSEVDFSSGKAELISPSITYPQGSGVAGLLEGMYYTLPENAEGVYKFVSIVVGSTAAITGNLVSYSTAQEIVGYVNSPNPNAYPPAEDDGFTYTALGMLGEKVKIATGSYTGTGTSGSSNKNSLTFGFLPKIVFISSNETNTGSGFVTPNDGGFGYAGGSTGSKLTTSVSGNTISWYTNTSNGTTQQLNSSGKKFEYIAIG